jgi:peptidoglycan/LPS O-acetylase OafA/YrhL
MKPLGYRAALDGVRCFAILPVVGLHAFGWPRQGSLGVDVFFVLSGFLITSLLLAERESTGSVSLRRFYGRRALRLLPALFAMLLAFLIATLISLSIHGNLDLSHLSAPLFGVVAALTYTANFAGAAGFHPAGLGHLWSLAEEEQFYLLWPPLLFVLLRAREDLALRIIGVGIVLVVTERMIIAISANEVPLYRLYNGPDTHSDPIMIGCLTALALSTDRVPQVLRNARSRKRAAIVSVIFIAAAIAFLERAWPLLYLTPLLTVFAAACAVVVMSATLDEGPLTRLLSFRPIAFGGKISYSLYLWHVPVLAFVGGWTGVALSCAFASMSYFFVEQPFLHRKRRWKQPITSKAAVFARV